MFFVIVVRVGARADEFSFFSLFFSSPFRDISFSVCVCVCAFIFLPAALLDIIF